VALKVVLKHIDTTKFSSANI